MNKVIEQTRLTGQGKFQFLPQQVQIDFEDGSAIIAPVGEATIEAASVAITAGDIIDIACKLFPKLCGGGGGGGGGGKPGCYVIVGPDGTTITICPPAKIA
ncbi:MAG: hypothetical protein KDI79_10180 [Anaerolineae bacterium]|nr:hypothetical protein [Anaerolineae bacterium]